MQNIVLKNFLYFNRLNKFTSSCELHPIKGFFPASILQKILAAVHIWLRSKVGRVFPTIITFLVLDLNHLEQHSDLNRFTKDISKVHFTLQKKSRLGLVWEQELGLEIGIG